MNEMWSIWLMWSIWFANAMRKITPSKNYCSANYRSANYHLLFPSDSTVAAKNTAMTETKYTASRVSRTPRLMEL